MYDFVVALVPTLLATLWLVALFSDPTAPCGARSQSPAATITEHLRAITNHVREIAILIADRTGASGSRS
ncbi:hypothetical protein SUDANB146_00023 [Streptomyces sp. enrichment culture]